MGSDFKNQLITQIYKFSKKVQDNSFKDKQERDEHLVLLILLSNKVKNPVTVLDYAILLGDDETIRTSAEFCIKKGATRSGLQSFLYLNDNESALNVLYNVAKTKSQIVLQSHLYVYLEKHQKRARIEFEKYVRKYMFSECIFSDFIKNSNMAYNLQGQYDLGIGIAKQGSFLSYIFQLFGTPIKIVEAHSLNNKDTVFREIDKIENNDIKGKRIIVLDNDVVTGRTANRVLEEILPYEPQSVDIAFSFTEQQGLITPNFKHLSEQYRNRYHPKMFDFHKYLGMIEHLNKKF